MVLFNTTAFAVSNPTVNNNTVVVQHYNSYNILGLVIGASEIEVKVVYMGISKDIPSRQNTQ